jgi:hypothetical protein
LHTVGPQAAGGDTQKKTFQHPKADPIARTQFQCTINAHEKAGNPIIYIDESGFALDMPRRYGYAKKGQRCYGTHDWQAKGRINVIGALRDKKLLTTCLCNARIDSPTFYAWVTQQLLPLLSQKSVIVMDNATFHKRQDIQEAIQSSGHDLQYLPTYSPDMNPIEHKWAQAKARRRKFQCTVEALFSDNKL